MTQLPEKIKDTAPEGTTFTSLGSTERKINEILTYLEEQALEHAEVHKTELGKPQTLTLKKPEWWHDTRFKVVDLQINRETYLEALKDVSNALGITINLE